MPKSPWRMEREKVGVRSGFSTYNHEHSVIVVSIKNGLSDCSCQVLPPFNQSCHSIDELTVMANKCTGKHNHL